MGCVNLHDTRDAIRLMSQPRVIHTESPSDPGTMRWPCAGIAHRSGEERLEQIFQEHMRRLDREQQSRNSDPSPRIQR
jgi:hypothetical protein